MEKNEKQVQETSVSESNEVPAEVAAIIPAETQASPRPMGFIPTYTGLKAKTPNVFSGHVLNLLPQGIKVKGVEIDTSEVRTIAQFKGKVKETLKEEGVEVSNKEIKNAVDIALSQPEVETEAFAKLGLAIEYFRHQGLLPQNVKENRNGDGATISLKAFEKEDEVALAVAEMRKHRSPDEILAALKSLAAIGG